MSFSISKYNLSDESPAFIIAEAGVNHNGDLDLALKLVEEAKECGADCVKFQTFEAERVVTKDAIKAEYQLKTTETTESQFDMLKKLELPKNAYQEIIKCCKDNDIIFMSTPYSVEDVDFLYNLGVPAFKLASISLVEPELIKHVAKKGLPVILSTGMCNMDEIEMAVRIIKSTGNNDFAFLQCTTNYPSTLDDANLKAMQTMRKKFKIVVGYSDHTVNDTACIVSIALGAKIIEKHFTLDKTLQGPDHSCSSNPSEFKNLVNNIRDAEIALGSADKKPSKQEKRNLIGMRRSIVSKKIIEKGTVVSKDMLIFKRPATGIAPNKLDEIVGKKSIVRINSDELITWDMFE